jgi:glycosyltransferase involved in cell wall biosynthesis
MATSSTSATPHSDHLRILVADAQVPFVEGGAELHVRALIEQLRRRGHAVEKVALPFRSQPTSALLGQAAAWRLLDLSSSHNIPIDVLIATRFPTYFARHPRKVAWVIHQHRAAYELCGTEFSDFAHREGDVAVRKRLIELDTAMLAECRHVFANAQNTANRLARFNGIAARALYHPPALADRLHEGPFGDYVLSVGRLERVKRADLVVGAMAHVDRRVRLLVVGDGTERAQLEAIAAPHAERIQFLGAAPQAQLVELYAHALGVVYAPFDEDYGYVTLEAFLAGKPVITAADSGGPLEFVEDGVNGFITPPAPESIAAAITRLDGDRGLAARLGAAGRRRAQTVTWDGVIEQLLG